MQIVIDIPEGLKKDFESEQWTALSCMEMKNALMNGTPLPKGHGDLIDKNELIKELSVISYRPVKSQMYIIKQAPTIIEADKEAEE